LRGIMDIQRRHMYLLAILFIFRWILKMYWNCWRF